ncbi:MAG: hypothetical protein GY800_09100 [Planctomycetes bacterium]|nr:hypothetical protein [Planctomycetota bacterium]
MKKLKHKKVWQVRTDFMSIESWLKIRKKQKEIKCTECKTMYSEILDSGVEKIALMSIKGEQNVHLCNDCGKRYIDELGAIDITAGILKDKKIKDDLILKISEAGATVKKEWSGKSIEELEDFLARTLKENEAKNELDAIEFTEEDLFVEDYLVKEYSVISDPNWLKSTTQIEDYFKDEGSDHLDCGQGYFQDEAEVIAKIGPKFYRVNFTAEIDSQKQDRGDRLYWVERIKSVTWEEIEKPPKKETVQLSYSFDLNVDQKKRLDSFLSGSGITWAEVEN